MSRTSLDWVPVKDGDRFCAPACGRGCTAQQYDTAVAKADALAARLGPGWEAVVWENLGWHHKAVSACGRWKVHPSHGSGYIAFIGDKGPGGNWTGFGKTPAAAIRAALKAAKVYIDELLTYTENPPAFLAEEHKRGR
jgi:hypothetical protein